MARHSWCCEEGPECVEQVRYVESRLSRPTVAAGSVKGVVNSSVGVSVCLCVSVCVCVSVFYLIMSTCVFVCVHVMVVWSS